jgi:hypothetical protein
MTEKRNTFWERQRQTEREIYTVKERKKAMKAWVDPKLSWRLDAHFRTLFWKCPKV